MPETLDEFLAKKRESVMGQIRTWTPDGTPAGRSGSATTEFFVRQIIEKTGVRQMRIIWPRAESDYKEQVSAGQKLEIYTVTVPFSDDSRLMDYPDSPIPQKLPPGVGKGYEAFVFRVEGTDLTPESARAQFDTNKEYVEALIGQLNGRVSLWMQALEAEAIPALDERRAYLKKKSDKLSAFGFPDKSSQN